MMITLSFHFQPTYQNQRMIQETVTTTKTAYPQSPPAKMISLNNNLSELDTLLQDLSNAHYAGYVEKKGKILYHCNVMSFNPVFLGRCVVSLCYIQFECLTAH